MGDCSAYCASDGDGWVRGEGAAACCAFYRCAGIVYRIAVGSNRERPAETVGELDPGHRPMEPTWGSVRQ
ncbi:hypothetical protein GCM10011594_43520 [Nakamurella endophytica]|uniref:Uncharacterized protein n=1 Tax=Nakamurella endophytica TaxID=1748367 RepID=A0A917TDF0_9ACTN|nr:hypothetical protein GCM10011594_43520 [Nakamurella endophytica]